MKNKLVQKLFFSVIAVGLITACNSGENSSASSIDNSVNTSIVKQDKSLASTSDIVFKSIASGLDSFCAMDQQDKIYCWGSGSYSQLGSGNTDNNYVPTPVLNPNNVRFTKIAGFSHNFCTLDEAGNIYCWGKGENGQIGNGTSNDVSSPTLITMPASVKFQSVIVGGGTSCALATNGHAYCWGQGESGQIGNGEAKNQFIPTEVIMPTTNEIFTELNISYYGPAFVCGLTDLGNVYCWGYAKYGVIGDGDTNSQYKSQPTKVTMPDTVTFSHLVPGMGNTACALDKQGILYCWGYNSHGEIGDGSFSHKSTPTVAIMPENEKFTLIATSVNTSCAETNKNNTYCWGYGADGQLGDGTIVNSAIPTLSGLKNHQIIKISSSYSMSSTLCEIDSDKKIFCWGYGADGSIGNGKNQDESVPTQVVFSESSTQFTDVVISGNSKTSCALTVNGQIYCWGYGADGQNGNGIKTNTNLPSLVITTPAITKLVSSSNFYSGTFCALHSNNNIYCWGYGLDGQIGNGQDQNESVPSKVQLPLDSKISELKASSSSFCGLDESGQVLCWGYGVDGQLGNREFLSSNHPVTVAMPYVGAAFIDLVASEESWCALDKFGMIYCWGYGAEGTIGNGKFDSVSQPTQVKLPSGVTGFKSLYADRADTMCAVANTSDLYCWGNGNYGQIGNKNNSYYNVNTPTKVDGNLKFDFVVGASGTFCGINHSDYRGYCWGMGNYGQIGNQQQSNQNSPIVLSDRNIVSPLINIVGSDSTFCAEDMGGGIYCWGRGDFGQIGNASMSNTNVPTAIQQSVDNLTLDFAVASSDTFCTLLSISSEVYCWGRGDLGQVGNGFSNNSSVPSKISDSNLTFANDLGKIISISAATDSFCLLNSLGHVYCWGDGFSGENGNGDYYGFKMEPTPLAFSY